MGNVSADKKLQLVKMIRNEHQSNRVVMQNREDFLYGKSRYHEHTVPLQAAQEDESNSPVRVSTFWFRFMIAAVLMISFVLWDNSQETFLGKQAKEVYLLLENESFVANIFDFMEDITYTLESNPVISPDVDAKN